MPTHFKTICSEIDELPPDVDFEVLQDSELGESGLSRGWKATMSLINQVNQAMFPHQTSPQTLPYLKLWTGEH